jgi:hypothetical protein
VVAILVAFGASSPRRAGLGYPEIAQTEYRQRVSPPSTLTRSPWM